MNYEELLTEADNAGITVDENYPFESNIKGLYIDNNIALSSNLNTTVEKACILAEELGHHYTASKDIIDQSSIWNRKQELKGQIHAFNRLVGLHGIIKAYQNHCQSAAECAEFLNVTEEFWNEAVEHYKNKYGERAIIDNYIIYFEPLGVLNLNI